MSEVIVRMEMPKGCYECPMYDFAVYRGKPMLCCNAHFALKSIPNNGNPRPSWCPIIGELPEHHGRLIDSDAFISTIRPLCEEDKFSACTFETVKRLMVEHINNAPTIVPADTAERNET